MGNTVKRTVPSTRWVTAWSCTASAVKREFAGDDQNKRRCGVMEKVDKTVRIVQAGKMQFYAPNLSGELDAYVHQTMPVYDLVVGTNVAP